MKKKTPNIASATRSTARLAPVKVPFLNKLRSSIGIRWCRSSSTNATSMTMATAKALRIRADVQPYVFASMSPYVREKSPMPEARRPGRSSRCSSDWSRDSGIRRKLAMIATTPIGTLTKKIQLQLMCSVSKPPTRGPIARARAETPAQIPIAVPRCRGGEGAAILASFVVIVFFLGDALTGEAEQLNNPESQQAYDLIGQRLPPNPREYTSDVVLIRSDTLTPSDPRFRAKVEQIVERLHSTPGVVNVIDTPAAQSRHAIVIEVGLADEAAAENVGEMLAAARDRAFDLYVTGEWTVENDFQHLSQDDLKTGELQFGLPVALVVLLLVFGAVIAGLVPLLLALVAIITALGLTSLFGIQFELSIFTVNMLSGMGLALGIDYSLFVVSRFREERSAGRDKLDAIGVTGTTASRAVLFSGMAFVVAMLGLLIIPNTIFRSLATGAILVGLTSVLAALTLLPAVLSLLGDRVNSLRIPVIGRGAERGTDAEGRFWGAIVRAVMRRPV